MTHTELASLLSNHTGPVTDQALRQLAVTVKDHIESSATDYLDLSDIQRALDIVEEAVKVEASDGA